MGESVSTNTRSCSGGPRGGGGNFGIVTGFEFELHPVGPEVATCLVFYPGDRLAEVLRAYRGFVADAPDEISTLVFADPLADLSGTMPYTEFQQLLDGDYPDECATTGSRCTWTDSRTSPSTASHTGPGPRPRRSRPCLAAGRCDRRRRYRGGRRDGADHLRPDLRATGRVEGRARSDEPVPAESERRAVGGRPGRRRVNCG